MQNEFRVTTRVVLEVTTVVNAGDKHDALYAANNLGLAKIQTQDDLDYAFSKQRVKIIEQEVLPSSVRRVYPSRQK